MARSINQARIRAGAQPGSNDAEVQRHCYFGVPLGGFGLIPSLVFALATGFIGFFAVTFLAIAGIGIYDALGHNVNLADSYRYISFPAGCLIMIVSLSFFGSLWLRQKFSRR